MDDAGVIPQSVRLQRYQRFGPDGPVYEVLGEDASPGFVAIQVIESGERLDYPFARALADPEA